MQLRAPPFEIPDSDPFKFDLLDRRPCAEALTELIRSLREPLVLSINSSWGNGKTTFVHMWRQLLTGSGCKSLYFNAWESDFSGNAFVSIMGELELGTEDIVANNETGAAAKSHLKKAKRIGAKIVKRAIPTAVKLATAGVINLDDYSEEALADFAEKLAEDQVSQYEESKKSVKAFKDQLSAYGEQVASQAGSESSFPLVIFIDELDRCRPQYAISVLEAVKHFFSVPNVVFVLVMDREQLGHSIRLLYGQGIDVDGYLRRFVDIEFNLPKAEKGKFCSAQFRRFGLEEAFAQRKGYRESQYDRRQFEEAFADLFISQELSLRDQERCFTLLSIALRFTPENFKLYPLLLAVLIILKIKKHDLYRGFVMNKCSVKDVIDFLCASQLGKDFLASNYGMAVEAFLVACRSQRGDQQAALAPYKEILRDDSKATSWEKQHAEKILQMLQSYEFVDAFGSIEYLSSKIDLASNVRT